jgi:hypothetical protein
VGVVDGGADGVRSAMLLVGVGAEREVTLGEDAGTGSAGTAVRTGSRSARALSRTRLSAISPPTASFGPCLARRSDMYLIIARSNGSGT